MWKGPVGHAPSCLCGGLQIRDYLAFKYDLNATSPHGGATSADAQLAASASMPLKDLQAAMQQLLASKDLSAAEAELAAANLALLMPADAKAAAAGAVGGGQAAGPRHVWYGDPLLSTSDARHSVEVRFDAGWLAGWLAGRQAGRQTWCRLLLLRPGWVWQLGHALLPCPSLLLLPLILPCTSGCLQGYGEMEKLLLEQQRQDWSMFEYSGQLVCRDVEGWQVRQSVCPQADRPLTSTCMLDGVCCALLAGTKTCSPRLIDCDALTAGGGECAASEANAAAGALPRPAAGPLHTRCLHFGCPRLLLRPCTYVLGWTGARGRAEGAASASFCVLRLAAGLWCAAVAAVVSSADAC